MHKWIRRGGCDHFGCNLPAALIRADESGRHGCVVGPARYRGRRGEDRRVQVPRDSLQSSTSTNVNKSKKKIDIFFSKKKCAGTKYFFFRIDRFRQKFIDVANDRRRGRTKKKNRSKHRPQHHHHHRGKKLLFQRMSIFLSGANEVARKIRHFK